MLPGSSCAAASVRIFPRPVFGNKKKGEKNLRRLSKNVVLGEEKKKLTAFFFSGV